MAMGSTSMKKKPKPKRRWRVMVPIETAFNRLLGPTYVHLHVEAMTRSEARAAAKKLLRESLPPGTVCVDLGPIEEKKG
jgi:hypothetical protein